MSDFGTPPDSTHILASLERQNELLSHLLTAMQTEQVSITASDHDKRSQLLRNDPLPGAQRLVTGRPGNGTVIQLAANVAQLLAQARATRIGGLVTVSAATTLVLCSLEMFNSTTATVQYPRLLLQAGQSWDMKLGDVLWTGNIVAVSTGTPNVYLAEI